MRAKALGPKPDHCAIEGCPKPYYAKGWCKTHYDRNRLKGDVNYVPVLNRQKQCEFESCANPQHANGLCKSHYAQKWRYGEPAPLRKWVRVDRTAWGQRCTECNLMKSWDDYYNRSDIPNKKQTNCKECWKERNRLYREKKKVLQNA